MLVYYDGVICLRQIPLCPLQKHHLPNEMNVEIWFGTTHKQIYLKKKKDQKFEGLSKTSKYGIWRKYH
jgi:hypothetical protein